MRTLSWGSETPIMTQAVLSTLLNLGLAIPSQLDIYYTDVGSVQVGFRPIVLDVISLQHILELTQEFYYN